MAASATRRARVIWPRPLTRDIGAEGVAAERRPLGRLAVGNRPKGQRRHGEQQHCGKGGAARARCPGWRVLWATHPGCDSCQHACSSAKRSLSMLWWPPESPPASARVHAPSSPLEVRISVTPDVEHTNVKQKVNKMPTTRDGRGNAGRGVRQTKPWHPWSLVARRNERWKTARIEPMLALYFPLLWPAHRLHALSQRATANSCRSAVTSPLAVGRVAAGAMIPASGSTACHPLLRNTLPRTCITLPGRPALRAWCTAVRARVRVYREAARLCVHAQLPCVHPHMPALLPPGPAAQGSAPSPALAPARAAVPIDMVARTSGGTRACTA